MKYLLSGTLAAFVSVQQADAFEYQHRAFHGPVDPNWNPEYYGHYGDSYYYRPETGRYEHD